MSQRNGTTQWLIHHAARHAPECLSSRLEEEWLSDLECQSSALSRLRFALGCCWATVVIVHDHSRTEVAAEIPVVTARGYIALADGSAGYVSLRSGTLFLIVGIHAALFSGLVSTLSHGLASPGDQNLALGPVPTEIEITSLLPAKQHPPYP